MIRTHRALGFPLVLLAAAPAPAQQAFPAGGGAASSAGFSAEMTVGDTFAGVAVAAGFSATAGFRASLPSNAPFGVLPPANAVAGADAAVTALLQDDVLVVSATLHYRAGGAGTFSQVPMALTDAGTGTWSGTIPGGDLSVQGVQYFVEASDGVNSSSIPATAPVAGLQSLSIAVADHPAFPLQATTYALTGVPLTPQSTDPLAVFDELGGFDNAVWRYGTFDPVAGAYREAGSAAPAAPGQGFWVIAANATTIDVSGTTADLGSNFQITLQPGFNQIANPFAFAVDFDDLALPAGADPNLIGWNGVAYVNGVQTLAPATGYWIFHGGTAAGTLEIPPLGTGIARGAPAVAPGAVPPGEEGAWSVSVVARAGECSDTDNRFGVRPGATDERDAFDFADAPAPPAGFVAASLVDAAGRRLLTDWRAPSEEGITWRLRLDTDRVGETFRVELGPEPALPGGWRLLAWPEDGGEAIDVTGGGTLSGVVTSTATSRRWVLAAGTPAFVGAAGEGRGPAGLASLPTEFAFGRPFPNPARASAGTSFEFRVPRATSASVAIFDVTGRRVATLVDGAVEAGTHTLRWDGRDPRGRRAASGVYFLRVRAEGFAHRDKVVVLD
jgi:hypothetical protein